jgi:hypothetical protein
MMPAEVTNVPIVVRSLIGHLEMIAQNEPDRPLTTYQVEGFNWILSHARAQYTDQRLQEMDLLTANESHTVEQALERLRGIAEVVQA